MTSEQDMINDLSLQLGRQKRLFTALVADYEKLIHRAHFYVYVHDNPPHDGSTLTPEKALAHLRGATRSALTGLGYIEEALPELYPYDNTPYDSVVDVLTRSKAGKTEEAR